MCIESAPRSDREAFWRELEAEVRRLKAAGEPLESSPLFRSAHESVRGRLRLIYLAAPDLSDGSRADGT